jgi:cellulose synthase/poly-beta-1,6-N-acetylglucosamine synthase-like glycosyltransferase
MLMTSYLSEPVAGTVVLLTLPLIAELVVLTLASLLPKRTSAHSVVSAPLHLAVIIPAHDEELLIASCVESLRASAAGVDTRIIVVAHNCSDQTAARAAAAGAEVIIYDNPLAKGKGSALSVGFAFASSQGMDATLVVDADSTVSSNLIGVVREAIANGAEAVQCRYEMDSSAERPASRLTSLAFRGFNVVRPAGRDRLGLSAGIVGNGFAIRQALLAQNSYNSLSVVEDLEFHIRLVLSSKRVQFLRDAKVSSAMPSSKQGEVTQRSRWEGGRANAARTWFVPLLKQLTQGRLRVLEPLLDLMSLPIGYAVFLLLIAACFPLVWLRVYVLLAVTVVGGHVLAAAWSGSDFAGDMRVLARAPGYILWKLCMLPRLLRSSRPEAAWVRTERQPAVQKVSLETAAESTPGVAMERVLRISNSLEIL